MAISLDAHDFIEGSTTGPADGYHIDGNTEKMIIKDLQYDHLGREVIHADLMRVDVTEIIKVSVPVELKGVAKGVAGRRRAQPPTQPARGPVPGDQHSCGDRRVGQGARTWASRSTPETSSCPKA